MSGPFNVRGRWNTVSMGDNREAQLKLAAAPCGGLVAGAGSLRLAADSAGLIDQLRGLEELKSAVAGDQARIAVAFDAVQRRSQAEAGVPAAERGQDVAAQIALARHE